VPRDGWWAAGAASHSVNSRRLISGFLCLGATAGRPHPEPTAAASGSPCGQPDCSESSWLPPAYDKISRRSLISGLPDRTIKCR
jgi:hypothetical protein